MLRIIVLTCLFTIAAFAQKDPLKCKYDAAKASAASCSKATPSDFEQYQDLLAVAKKCEDTLTDDQVKALSELGMDSISSYNIPKDKNAIKTAIEGYDFYISSMNDVIDPKVTIEEMEKKLEILKAEANKFQEKFNQSSSSENAFKWTSKNNEVSQYQSMIIYKKQSVPNDSMIAQKSMYENYKKNLVAELAKMEDEKSDKKDEKKDEKQKKREKVEKYVENRVQNMKGRSWFKDCGLTKLELVAVDYYSGSGYRNMNAALRKSESDKEREKYRILIDALNSALDKLENHEGLVRRGTQLPVDVRLQHCLGCVVTYPSFTSTSTGHGFGGSQRFVIKSKTGKYIAPLSNSPNEEEVLFKSGAKFRVVNVKDNEYTMEEVEE